MCCSDYSAKYLYPTFRLAANEGGGGLAETRGHITGAPGAKPVWRNSFNAAGTYHTSRRWEKSWEKMIGKTDVDISPNRLGEVLFRRGRKSRLTEEKVQIIIVYKKKSTYKPLVTHHTTANVPRNKLTGIRFFPSSDKQGMKILLFHHFNYTHQLLMMAKKKVLSSVAAGNNKIMTKKQEWGEKKTPSGTSRTAAKMLECSYVICGASFFLPPYSRYMLPLMDIKWFPFVAFGDIHETLETHFSTHN